MEVQSFRTLKRLSSADGRRESLARKHETKKGPSFHARSLVRSGRHYFLIFTFFFRAADPYRLLKHFRHRRSRRLMKLGARSSEPQ